MKKSGGNFGNITRVMSVYLVGIMYHDTESYRRWNKGLMEDYESSTGFFITAESEADALAWGDQISAMLFKKINPDENADWKSFGYDSWIENIEGGYWKESYGFFQRVNYGELPNFDLMGDDAYEK